MFDNFDLYETCEEFWDDEPVEDWEENETMEDWEEREDFPDDHLWDTLEMGFDPYMGCYSWDC